MVLPVSFREFEDAMTLWACTDSRIVQSLVAVKWLFGPISKLNKIQDVWKY